MPGARFFPDARLNFAENLLRRQDDDAGDHVSAAKTASRQTLTAAELRRESRAFAAALRRAGIRPRRPRRRLHPQPARRRSSRLLGAAAIGAVWSSCSPDFGVQGVLDRFGQIAPRVLIAADAYVYGGKTHDCLGQARRRRRARCRRSSSVVVVPYVVGAPGASIACRTRVLWDGVPRRARPPS